MRLNLNQEASRALEGCHARCHELNPDIEPALSVFLLQLLQSLELVISKDQWREIAARSTSERIKRKRIVERLLKLGETLDESDIEKFEAKIERRRMASSSENGSFSAENS